MVTDLLLISILLPWPTFRVEGYTISQQEKKPWKHRWKHLEKAHAHRYVRQEDQEPKKSEQATPLVETYLDGSDTVVLPHYEVVQMPEDGPIFVDPTLAVLSEHSSLSDSPVPWKTISVVALILLFCCLICNCCDLMPTSKKDFRLLAKLIRRDCPCCAAICGLKKRKKKRCGKSSLLVNFFQQSSKASSKSEKRRKCEKNKLERKRFLTKTAKQHQLFRDGSKRNKRCQIKNHRKIFSILTADTIQPFNYNDSLADSSLAFSNEESSIDDISDPDSKNVENLILMCMNTLREPFYDLFPKSKSDVYSYPVYQRNVEYYKDISLTPVKDITENYKNQLGIKNLKNIPHTSFPLDAHKKLKENEENDHSGPTNINNANPEKEDADILKFLEDVVKSTQSTKVKGKTTRFGNDKTQGEGKSNYISAGNKKQEKTSNHKFLKRPRLIVDNKTRGLVQLYAKRIIQRSKMTTPLSNRKSNSDCDKSSSFPGLVVRSQLFIGKEFH